MRGAWAEQQDGDSGEIATQHLRAGTTWSGLALSYRNSAGENMVLVQLFWIRGKSNRREDLRRHYLIFERPFDLRDLDDFQLDVRKLKLKFPDVFAREDFSPYAERFRRRFGIDNELALKLLHRTQSAKNLGDLNTFLRDFMLDKPETFAAAHRLVAEFAELNAAHQAVVTAREQVQTLSPAREEHLELHSVRTQEEVLRELRAGLDGYKQTCRVGLLQERIIALEGAAATLRAEQQERQAAFDNNRAGLDDLRRRHREAGGGQIEDLRNEKNRTEEARDGRLRNLAKLQSLCGKLSLPFRPNPPEFAELCTTALREVEAWPAWLEESREKHARLSATLEQLRKAFSEANEEVESLRRQPSNVPARTLEVESLRRQPSNVPARTLKVRAAIAAELGIAENALPFAAELIEVLPQEEEWRGVVERVLRGMALSVIVEDRYYAAVSDWVDRSSVGDRLLYNRVAREPVPPVRHVQPDSLFRKLKIKEGPLSAYIANTLVQRFDYACVDSMQAFRNTDKAITRQGQARHTKDRHEKDDRFELNDRGRWVLGFDNRAKLALFEEKAREAARALGECDRAIRELNGESKQRSDRVLVCQTVSHFQWQEIDAAPLLERLAAIEKLLRELQEDNTTLKEIDHRLKAQEETVRKSENAVIGVRAQAAANEKETREIHLRLDSLVETVKTLDVTPSQRAGIPKYLHRLNQPITLDNLDRLAHEADRAMTTEQAVLADARVKLINSIEKRFAEFQRRWRMDSGDLDATLASAPDYFSKLKRLETDGLPDYEQRFFDLLRNQSHQNLAALSKHISQARKTIFDRLELVNQSLGKAEFGPGTYLQIEASDRNLDEVRQFKQEIQQALSHAWTDDRDQAEERFLILRGLVDRLGGQETDQKRWQALVLDVRQHVEFIGRERDMAGSQIEVYRGGGGKSGGQRQTLATTCLAAALRYQLGGDDQSPPRYGPVILDEAFDKADNEFTERAMKIFEKFGFQMIVATPLKSVMTLEPIIGGACFVDIKERRHSGVLMIEYDSERQRLNLPERSREEAGVAVS